MHFREKARFCLVSNAIVEIMQEVFWNLMATTVPVSQDSGWRAWVSWGLGFLGDWGFLGTGAPWEFFSECWVAVGFIFGRLETASLA
jgi:hypothetical protein